MKKTIGERLFDFWNILFLVCLSIITLYPLLYILFASVSDPTYVAQNRGIMLSPKDFTLEAYTLVFKNPMIVTSYLNTLFYVVIGTILNIFLTSLGAYALSRKNVMWANLIMFLIVFSMFFEGGLIPSYLLVSELNMIDTRWALIFPTAVSAFNLIIMRTAFQGIPASLEESARIDGANDFTILFKIILPLSLPVVAVMILFYGVYHWNSWFPAMIYLQDRELFPVQLILREILIANDTSSMTSGVGSVDAIPIGETVKYATIVVATLPILCLYPFLQKYFVKGVMIGGIKG
ncbi:carbohydrate ABC transporter permease [Metabacillus malikii]|uniref:Aldouronate transport system permease protein n=1 Tax=Metabacillus malikii TaxID=1504265 RepID=A0ABT9ZAD3_9BACI|nr:carbohydrate ABC transporter permease [Metabacillus malikii]MDQ0229197.1 putative aldouronate transport system permease protein [Metabacillus malikii]